MDDPPVPASSKRAGVVALLAWLAIAFLIGVLCAGCCSAPPALVPVKAQDRAHYLLGLDPSVVTLQDLQKHATDTAEHLETYCQHHGIAWPAIRTSQGLAHPDRFHDGADSGIFTGYLTAAYAFRYGATGNPEHLDKLARQVDALWILTNATGTPGVIARCAFRVEHQARFGYPAEWEGRAEFTQEGPELFLDGRYMGRWISYTRPTRDQLAGIVLGLAAAWRVLDEAQDEHASQALALQRTIGGIALSIQEHLERYSWNLRDHRGKNDTNADGVDGLARLQVLALIAFTSGDSMDRIPYDRAFFQTMRLQALEAPFCKFANASQYYSHNLRCARSLTLWLLQEPEPDQARMASIREQAERDWWRHVRHHQGAWFAFARDVIQGEQTHVQVGLDSLRSCSLRPFRALASPYAGQGDEPGWLHVATGCSTAPFVLAPHLRKPADYFTFEKAPWDTGHPDPEALRDQLGLGFLVSYWLARWAGFVGEF